MDKDVNAWNNHYAINKQARIIADGLEKFDFEKSSTPYMERLDYYIRTQGLRNALEFGCGTAGTSYILKKRHGIAVTLLDCSKEALEMAREIFGCAGMEAEYIEAELPPLPVETGTYDLIHGNTVLEHIRDYEFAFSEIVRALKPGGYGILTVPNRMRPDASLWYRWAHRLRYYTREFSAGELKELCHRNKVEAVEVFGSGALHISLRMLIESVRNLISKPKSAWNDDSEASDPFSSPSPAKGLKSKLGKLWMKPQHFLTYLSDRVLRLDRLAPGGLIVIGIVFRKPL